MSNLTCGSLAPERTAFVDGRWIPKFQYHFRTALVKELRRETTLRDHFLLTTQGLWYTILGQRRTPVNIRN